MKIVFDHCYQHNGSEQDFLDLQTRGFSTEDYVVEHPGKLFCRFIRMKKSTGGLDETRYPYLEFAEVKDLEALKSRYSTEVSDHVALRPGFSLSCDENLKALYETARAQVPELKPVYAHKNYKWKEDNISSLPGWNFLDFEHPVVNDTHIWWTEYESDPSRIRPKTPPHHPNSVDHFHGFLWNLKLPELSKLQILTQAETHDGALVLSDGLKIYTADSPDFPEVLRQKAKTYSFTAVILTCTHWETFLAQAKPELVFTWKQRRAGLIKMPGAWDLMVFEAPAEQAL